MINNNICIWLIAVIAGFFLGATCGSASLMVRIIVGFVMTGLVGWLISGILK